jgi:hypothetical protein
MANAERGEVDLTIGGVTYTMVLTTNALCELEDLMSTTLRPVTYADVLIQSKKGSTRAMRATFWASLRKHHRDVTVEKAGDLMDAADDQTTFAEKLARLAFAAMPADDDVKALGLKTGGENRPPKAQRGRAGTGTRSASKHVTSD